MPWLYSGPEDRVCKLRGCSDGEEDEDDEDGGRRVHEYWDGSRDVWVTHVAERVDPDAIATQVGLPLSTDEPVAQSVIDDEVEENTRSIREEQEIEEALASDKEDNAWSWVRKRLIGARGSVPQFQRALAAPRSHLL
eukprot:2814823-Rhodomonas_salina.1